MSKEVEEIGLEFQQIGHAPVLRLVPRPKNDAGEVEAVEARRRLNIAIRLLTSALASLEPRTPQDR